VEQHDIIVAIAVGICGAFVTGSVAFVIRSLAQDIEQSKESAKQDSSFNSQEIRGVRASLDSFKSEERHKDDDLKGGIESAKLELREEIKDAVGRVESVKNELRGELHTYWERIEITLESRRQDIYQLHGKIDTKVEKLLDKLT
jgi:chromosome segregation ATPase